MTNSQRIRRLIEEYNRQLIGVEKMLITLHTAEFMLKMEHIKVSSQCRVQKNNKKSAIIWGSVNVFPLTLGLITLNPFSIGLSGGLVIFEAFLGIHAHIKGKKLAKMEQNLEKAVKRTSAYISHLESQREYFANQIQDLEEILEKARAKGQEPSDQLLLEAMHGKTTMLLEAGGTEKYVTPELTEKIDQIESDFGFAQGDGFGMEIE